MSLLKWLGINWKSVGSIVVALSLALFGWTQSLEARFDDIEDTSAQVKADLKIEIDANTQRLNTMSHDLKVVRCIAVAQVNDTNPVGCLDR